VNIDVEVVGGVAVESVPEEVRKLVVDKPLAPPEPPKEGWEVLDVVEQRPAEAVEIVKSARGCSKLRWSPKLLWLLGTPCIRQFMANLSTGFHGYTRCPGNHAMR